MYSLFFQERGFTNSSSFVLATTKTVEQRLVKRLEKSDGVFGGNAAISRVSAGNATTTVPAVSYCLVSGPREVPCAISSALGEVKPSLLSRLAALLLVVTLLLLLFLVHLPPVSQTYIFSSHLKILVLGNHVEPEKDVVRR